jgi:tetratricopeptide (TPR) repeat protein/uncharacterized protein YjbI with pentapeptide repeats
MSREPKRKALIIGISYYTSTKLEQLDFCKNDGEKMYELLESLGYEISENNKLIGEVEGEKVRDQIHEFFGDSYINADDTLLFYYSGHGVPDVDGIYLASSDIDPDKPYRRGFSFEELSKMAERSISTRVVVILDCCSSGAAKLSSKGMRTSKGDEDNAAKLGRIAIDETLRKLPQGQGTYVLASSLSSQASYDLALTTSNHSIYTYYLLQGLKGNTESVDSEGNVTPRSLGSYVHKAITNLPADKRPTQTPITKASESGNVILAYYPELKRTRIEVILASLSKLLQDGNIEEFNRKRDQIPIHLLNFSLVNLHKRNLSKANLSNVNMSKADLSNADLDGANLSDANMFMSELEGAYLHEVNLSNADLNGANLSNSDLSKANLSNTDLSNANLSKANLFRTYFKNTKVINTKFFGSDISRAILDAPLWGAIFESKEQPVTQPPLTSSTAAPVTQPPSSSPSRGTKSTDTNLTGADLRDSIFEEKKPMGYGSTTTKPDEKTDGKRKIASESNNSSGAPIADVSRPPAQEPVSPSRPSKERKKYYRSWPILGAAAVVIIVLVLVGYYWSQPHPPLPTAPTPNHSSSITSSTNPGQLSTGGRRVPNTSQPTTTTTNTPPSTGNAKSITSTTGNQPNISSSNVSALINIRVFDLVNQSNIRQAIQYYDKALAINPNDNNALANKGIALYNLGNYTQAIQYYDKALAINPNTEVALANKGIALDIFGTRTQAIQYYDKALAINPRDNYTLDRLAIDLETSGNLTGALKYANKALAMDPNDTFAYGTKTLALSGLKPPPIRPTSPPTSNQSATTTAQKTNTNQPSNQSATTAANALANKGGALDNLGDHTQAIQYYDKALAIDPNDKYALVNKGAALDYLGNYTQAIQYYDKALAIDPNYVDALVNKSAALEHSGNYPHAIQYYDKALAINPRDKYTLDHLASDLAILGNWTGAIKYANKALAMDPNDTFAYGTKTLALNVKKK